MKIEIEDEIEDMEVRHFGDYLVGGNLIEVEIVTNADVIKILFTEEETENLINKLSQDLNKNKRK